VPPGLGVVEGGEIPYSVDRAAFYQLKTMMQGVLARGTAHSIADLASRAQQHAMPSKKPTGPPPALTQLRHRARDERSLDRQLLQPCPNS
jgi:hypothetical protein